MADIAGDAPLPLTALSPGAAVLTPRALVPAQKGGKAASRSKAPPAMDRSVFDATWFEAPPTRDPRHAIFANILAEHNRRFDQLEQFREAVLAAAETESQVARGERTTNFLETIGLLLGEARSSPVLPPNTTPLTQAGPDDLTVYSMLIADFARGNRHAFNPFDGWWSGLFRSGSGDAHNVHIWDPTVPVDQERQYVQAVTQAERPKTDPPPPVDSSGEPVSPDASSEEQAITRADSRWFVSAARLRRRPACLGEANFAINVFDETHGLTGYVWKNVYDQNRAELKLPHVGFRLDVDTLLWIASNEPGATAFETTTAVDLFMFVEIGLPRADYSGTYRIRGTYIYRGVRWDTDGPVISGRFRTDGFGRNNYRQIAPYGDVTDLVAAKDLGLVGKTHRSAIRNAECFANPALPYDGEMP